MLSTRELIGYAPARWFARMTGQFKETEMADTVTKTVFRFVQVVSLTVFLSVTPAQSTLVLLLPTREGVVVCADKREWNRVEGPSDNAEKIYKLGDSALFVVDGVSELLNPSTLKREYSLTDSVRQFYAKRPFKDTPQEWEALKSFLKNSFETSYRERGTPIETLPGSTDDVAWEVNFVYHSNRAPVIKQIEYHLGGAVTEQSLPQEPYITGQTDVVLRVLKSKQFPDTRFSDLMGIVQIERAWNHSAAGYPENVAVQDALFSSYTLIRASAERMHLLNKPQMVGSTCDCALIGKPSGFSWLKRNFDTREARLPPPQ
jgi:hypothetical protein